MASKRVSLKGKGADLFFGDYQHPATVDQADAPTSIAAEPVADAGLTERLAPETAPADPPGGRSPTPPSRAITPARQHDRKRASVLASTEPIDDELIAAIRRVVRTPGREVSYVRLSMEEKTRLGEVVYTFKRQGHKLTETDISRIAVNCLLTDYDRHGEASVLARVLASLRE